MRTMDMPTGNAGGAEPAPLAGQQGALDQANQAQGGQPVTRAPKWQTVHIYEVRDYNRNGRTMFSFNNGSLHLSYAQLFAAGVENPNLLFDTDMLVDFFQIGEQLLNGDVVRDANRIIRQFVPAKDMELEREVAKDLKVKKINSWATRVTQTIGGNQAVRQTGITGATPSGQMSAATPGAPFQRGAFPLEANQQSQVAQNTVNDGTQGIGNPATGGEEQGQAQ